VRLTPAQGAAPLGHAVAGRGAVGSIDFGGWDGRGRGEPIPSRVHPKGAVRNRLSSHEDSPFIR
jgi:hypothetical protein